MLSEFLGKAIEDLLSKSLPEVAFLISSRAISTVDLVETYLNRIEEVNPSLNAVVTIAPDVLESAKASAPLPLDRFAADS